MIETHHSFIVKECHAKDLLRDEFEVLYADCANKKAKSHILDIMVMISRQVDLTLALIYLEDKLVGASAFYTKNKETQNSTCSLYNLFSLSPGAGSLAFEYYWKYASTNARWFKFYVSKHAHLFYNKRNLKYFGASKTGDTYFAFGRITSSNMVESMNAWNVNYKNLTGLDQAYFDINMKMIIKKNTFGYPKLKGLFKSYLDENLLPLDSVEITSLDNFFS